MSAAGKINWLEWSKEAFELSKKENKPVILDIYGVWCHWCHQMERTYSDPDVARIIAENFIAIKADTDKRPDINERYNQGGWPSTVFLTDEGKIITGATYLKPPEMKNLLGQVLGLYRTSGSKVEGDVLSIKPKPAKKPGITDLISSDVTQLVMGSFDAEYGGIGYEPKFPVTAAIELALLEYKKTKNEDFLNFVTVTLGSIAGSMGKPVTGIFDNEEGGFFRYSVSRNWSLPHYEKMLETNALLLVNYLHAYQVTGNAKYKEVAGKTISYVKNNLTDPEGGFYSSQDADGEDEYYGLTADQRKKLEQPQIDRTVYTNYSSIMISSFIDAYLVLGDEQFKESAVKAADFLVKSRYEPGKGAAHCQCVYGFLSDNVHFLKALLDCFGVTNDKKYMDAAKKTASFLAENLKEKGGAFFDRTKKDDDVGLLKAMNKPIEENSVAAECFLRLSALTGDESFKKTAEEVLEDFCVEYKRYGIGASVYAAAIEKFIDPVEIVVVGMKKGLPPLLSYFEPRKIVVFLDLEKDKELAAKKGYTAEGIFVCHRMTCNRFATAEEAVRYLEASA